MLSVWIDQDLCTGVAVCVDRCPEVFAMGSDGLGYVRTPSGLAAEGTAADDQLENILDAIEACPVECIFVEG